MKTTVGFEGEGGATCWRESMAPSDVMRAEISGSRYLSRQRVCSNMNLASRSVKCADS